MENNQQRQSTNSADKHRNESFSNQQPGQQVPNDSEMKNETRFSETSTGNEQHSESSKPDAENETLGTP